MEEKYFPKLKKRQPYLCKINYLTNARARGGTIKHIHEQNIEI